jgi:hypothetical protein
MTYEKALAIFNYWFDHDGHWMFGASGKDKALAAWKLYGIEGLPDYVWNE